jgi:hypothetical protein
MLNTSGRWRAGTDSAERYDGAIDDIDAEIQRLVILTHAGPSPLGLATSSASSAASGSATFCRRPRRPRSTILVADDVDDTIEASLELEHCPHPRRQRRNSTADRQCGVRRFPAPRAGERDRPRDQGRRRAWPRAVAPDRRRPDGEARLAPQPGAAGAGGPHALQMAAFGQAVTRALASRRATARSIRGSSSGIPAR